MRWSIMGCAFKARHDHHGILAALGFVDRARVGEGDVAEVAAVERLLGAVEVGFERAGLGVD